MTKVYVENEALDNEWKTFFISESCKPYFLDIVKFLKQERLKGKIIYPAESDIFNAIQFTPFSDVKVVIVGQDPYHNLNQAHGFAFSVKHDIKLPLSLINIFKALKNDCGVEIPNQGCLEKWTKQGVLLLNAILTVEENKPHSHANIGWEQFTDAVISHLNSQAETIVYLLWGAQAQKKAALIDTKKHVILTAPHPSPLSAHRGFLNCKHFSKANAILKKAGRIPVDW